MIDIKKKLELYGSIEAKTKTISTKTTNNKKMKIDKICEIYNLKTSVLLNLLIDDLIESAEKENIL